MQPGTQEGYTQVPNWIFALMPRLNGAQTQVLFALARALYGWHKEADTISLSQLEGATGLNRETVAGAVQQLEGWGVINRTPARRNGYTYRLNEQPVEAIPSTSRKIRLVGKSDYSLVGKSDPQKKEKEITTPSGVVDAAPAAAPTQADGPKRERQRERKAPPPASTKVLYEPLFALVNRGRTRAINLAVYTTAPKLDGDYQATPQQVARFAEFWRRYPHAAQRAAAKDRRPLNPPLPAQILELWPQFLDWLRAENEAREREERETQARDMERQQQAEQRRAGRDFFDRERANWWNTGSGGHGSGPPVAMTAMGRRT